MPTDPVHSTAAVTSAPTQDVQTITPLQQAIRARARDTLESAARQPKPTLQRRLLVAVMVMLALLMLLLLIDFGVRVMHHILTVWYGDPNATTVQPAPSFDPSKPFYITVDPPTAASETRSSTATANTPATVRP